MHKAEIDLSVLIIFFARPNTLQEVFDRVKAARPSKLFLSCDGARENKPGEAERVEECKKIVSDIDWECEVHTNYSDVNLGCGKGPESAITWAFKHTDKLVILEDDCVPDPSFFPYMKELLDKYENDTRIGIVSGFNHFKDWNAGGNSYFFTKRGATLGWGTWKRVWDSFDFHVDGITDPYYKSLLEKEVYNKGDAKSRVESWTRASYETREKKVNYWDVQFGFVKYSQSYLCIVPKSNMIYNIGVGLGSTHTEDGQVVSNWKPGQVLFMPTKEMDFPLVHPKYVICDRKYDEDCYNKILKRSFFKKVKSKIKRFFKK